MRMTCQWNDAGDAAPQKLLFVGGLSGQGVKT
jgi:hypothetical protein